MHKYLYIYGRHPLKENKNKPPKKFTIIVFDIFLRFLYFPPKYFLINRKLKTRIL